MNRKGELVLGMGDGYKLVPPITLPPTATNISIGTDGTVQYTPAGSVTKQTAGQLKLTLFPNPQGLQLLGGSIYAPTPASGQPLNAAPGVDGTGQTMSGFLESSNVDPVTQLVTLIKTQRSFELNSQSIQTADQALQVIGNLRKG